MKRNVGFMLAILLQGPLAISQDDYIQRPTLGIFFFLNDFKTASDIRTTSLRQVLRAHQFGKVKDMSPGLAINYINGLSPHFDFTSTLSGVFLDYITNQSKRLGEDNLLLEGDVSIKGKLFSNRYWVSPFLQAGAGISTYSSYWGTFIPVGSGVQVNLFDEAFMIINAQYRIGVTNTTGNHFFYSIGLAGVIGRRRTSTHSVLPQD